MTKEDFLSLYEKHIKGLCTPEEEELLNSWKDEIKLLDDSWDPDIGIKSEIYNNIFDRLTGSIKSDHELTGKSRFNFNWFNAAAAILLVLTMALYIKRTPTNNKRYSNVVHSKILPGTNKAYLTLSNGSQIILSDANKGEMATESGVQLKKAKDGLIVYDHTKDYTPSANKELIYNTITTPRGGQYQVVLDDGTKVWLNAASSLRFPVTFTGKDRRVELSGEGYFEVAKNKAKPFFVQANNAIVQVFGTHFNVSAYRDDETVTTTLVEGSVRMTKGGSATMLTPGHQATALNQGDGITVRPADIEEALAWKNGFFTFRDENIVSIMKKVSRWYDVDVIYEGDAKSMEFGGTVSRYKNITELLNIIKLTGSINYKIEGRRVTIIK